MMRLPSQLPLPTHLPLLIAVLFSTCTFVGLTPAPQPAPSAQTAPAAQREPAATMGEADALALLRKAYASGPIAERIEVTLVNGRERPERSTITLRIDRAEPMAPRMVIGLPPLAAAITPSSLAVVPHHALFDSQAASGKAPSRHIHWQPSRVWPTLAPGVLPDADLLAAAFGPLPLPQLALVNATDALHPLVLLSGTGPLAITSVFLTPAAPNLPAAITLTATCAPTDGQPITPTTYTTCEIVLNLPSGRLRSATFRSPSPAPAPTSAPTPALTPARTLTLTMTALPEPEAALPPRFAELATWRRVNEMAELTRPLPPAVDGTPLDFTTSWPVIEHELAHASIRADAPPPRSYVLLLMRDPELSDRPEVQRTLYAALAESADQADAVAAALPPMLFATLAPPNRAGELIALPLAPLVAARLLGDAPRIAVLLSAGPQPVVLRRLPLPSSVSAPRPVPAPATITDPR